jgi:hypothetical protein
MVVIGIDKIGSVNTGKAGNRGALRNQLVLEAFGQRIILEGDTDNRRYFQSLRWP